jgi:hypothetical protein
MKKTDFRLAMLGVFTLGIFSSVVLVRFFTLSVDEPISITTTTVKAKPISPSLLVTDGNMVLASTNDSQRGYWLTGRETSFALNGFSERKNRVFKISAGLDPCGRQTRLEVSALGQTPITLDSKSTSVTYSSAVTRLYARSLGAACLIDTDARVFFGRLEVSVTGLDLFTFDQ